MIEIKSEKFNGPLGLLLELIEKEELDITEVSLAKIADQYIERIKNDSNIAPETTADFLVVAAKLLYIKSKALLPYLYPEDDKEVEELEDQLRMYKEFLEAMKRVEEMIGEKRFMYSREFSKKNVLEGIQSFTPPKGIVMADLNRILVEIIKGFKVKEEKLKEKKLEDKISIEDKILELKKIVFDKIKVSFKNILKHSKNKTEMIVNFLAMLELIKQRDIFAEQEEMFGDIMIGKEAGASRTEPLI